MRLPLAAALCLALSACVTSKPPGPDLTGINPEHDAYCRSLMMPPGTLVYVQCRLAMSETQRHAEERRRQLLRASAGPLPPEVDSILREDVFCNFNESTKLSVDPALPSEAALTAADRCAPTRARMAEAIRVWQPMSADALTAAYDRDAIATNTATIEEARAFR